jgi:tRNA-modifying protein YgfZ
MLVQRQQLEGYEAARDGAVFHVTEQSGYILLEGPDRVDFLQRQTTNDVANLADTLAVHTVLTTPTARILDVLMLINKPDAFGILTIRGRSASTIRFLQSRIFFMDKVVITDASATYVQIDLDGPRLEPSLKKANLPVPEHEHVVDMQTEDIPITLIGKQGLNGPSVRLIASASSAARVETILKEIGLVQISTETYEALRVEVGIPGIHELSEAYTPLEIGLVNVISDSKGCYTGQEIIARQISYDKVTRNLVGLRLSGAVDQGSSVQHKGRKVGELTSVVESPRFGWIGLAVLKRPANEVGTGLTIFDGSKQIRAVVTSLPFRE